MAMYKAQLVGVYQVREIPDELRPFLNLEAAREKRELKLSDKAVMLQVVGTSAYIAVFLDTVGSVSKLAARLHEQDTEMTEITKMTIERLLMDRKGA